ncbi:CHAT domain-containing protein [Cryobacterium sp. W22_MBD10_FK3]|uniref:CHAT domain-containing protein n=1 Tax=Cryobacterium sp. W22_MBD10_FK3 TaxID=3240273 RepID=UPI003F8E586D
MDSETSAAFDTGRRIWLDHLATLVLDSTCVRVFADSSLTPIEQAMLVVHVGTGHLYGIADSDSIVEGVLSAEQIEVLISRYWLDGQFNPYLARTIPFLWASLYRLGRDTQTVQKEILGLLFNSQLGRRMQDQSSSDLDPGKIDTQASELVSELQLHQDSNDDRKPLALDCENSHLGLVDMLLAAEVPITIDLLTLLEVQATIPLDSQARQEVAALEEAGNQHEIFRSMPGGWPGPAPSDVPGWVRDIVQSSGARMYYASTGHIPGWLIVAESEQELRAIHQWSYEPNFGFAVDNEGNPVLLIQLTFASDDETADAAWRYPLQDVRSVTRLRALIAIGVVRLDVYKISADARLEFIFAFGCPLPIPLREACLLFLETNSLSPSQVRLFHPTTPEDELDTMSLVEGNMFDGLSRGMNSLRTDASSELADAYRNHLATLDSATAALFGGLRSDNLYKESRETLRIALAQEERPARDTIDVGLLGEGRAYLQFRVIFDEPVRLVAYAAYRGGTGALQTMMAEFDGEFSSSWDLDQQATALSAGLSGLRAMLSDGVSKLIVCPAPAAYNLPYHEALLRLGFEEVSYTHRVATLRPAGRSGAEDTAVVGFAGEGTLYIEAVDTELEIVSRLHKAARTAMIPGTLPRLVHLAGHGHAGNQSYETAMEIGADGPPLSSARVLLDFDASGCELVFLSACSSGRGAYDSDQMAEAIPMDIAFIEAGARTVVSTSKPVNDYIACFFAAVFHAELLVGKSTWESYINAREAARSGRLPKSAELVDALWPNWENDVRAALTVHPHDWASYRLSGRHWD